MVCCRRFCQSGLSVFAGLLLSFSSARAEDAPWEAWIPSSPGGYDEGALRQKFSLLSKEQRVAAGLHLIQKWGRDARKEVFAVAEACEIPLQACFEHWTRRDFESALERAEQWDGFGSGTLLRRAVFLAVAKSDPVEAARRMRARLDPMSRTYYYYVTMGALVPSLTDQPARVILQALQEMRSDLFFLDEFRWEDAAYELTSTRTPWNSPNPSRDWEYLISQPPSAVRDVVLSVALHVWLKRDLEKAITVEVPPLYREMLKYRLQDAFPDDLEKVPDLLPVANFELMRSWVRKAHRKNVQPEWRQWAALSAHQPEPAAQQRALDTVMRLWLEWDEAAARAWVQELPSGRARDLAEAACLEAEIDHLVSEDWSRALSLAKSMPEGARRQRCLKVVFAGAASQKFNFVQRELAALSLPEAQQAQIRDVWRLSRSDHLQRLQINEGHDPLGAYALILELEDAGLRRILARDHLGPLQSHSRGDLHALIEKSSMSREDKDACLFQIIVLDVDGSLRVVDRESRLKLSVGIADDQTRFVHQRAVVRELAEEQPEKAAALIDGSPIKEQDKQRLRQDLERTSKWERPQKAKAAK